MTTIALFLHTLKFKGWLGPRTATVAYEGAYLITAWFYWQFLGTIAANLDLALLCFIGMVLNFAPKGIWHAYQAFVLAYLWHARATGSWMLQSIFVFFFFLNQKVKGIQTLGIHSIQTWTCFYFATPEVPQIPAKLPSQASATSMPVSTLPPLLSLPAMIMGQAWSFSDWVLECVYTSSGV